MTEIRYRRLLALYPRDFRHEYGDEMVSVLMADPRPGAAQVLDVVRGAVVAHLRGLWTGESRAARVVQIFGAMLLFAVALRRVVAEVSTTLLHYEFVGLSTLETMSFVRLAGWGVALIAAYFGWRVLGVAGASAGLAGEILVPARSYLDTPASVLWAYWLIVAAVLVLAAGLIASGPSRGPARPQGWEWIAAASLVLALSSLVDHVVRIDAFSKEVRLAPVLAAAVLVLVAVLRQEREVRTRLLCWAAPVIATVPLVQWGFGGFIEYNMRHPESTRLINPLQWAVLVLVPAVVFVGASLLDRRNRVRGDGGAGPVTGGLARRGHGEVRGHE